MDVIFSFIPIGSYYAYVMFLKYYWNNITWKHKEIRYNKSVGMEENLYDDYKVESKGKNVVIEMLLYASFLSMEIRI